ncbi:MAG: GntR family transcriptional regulator [Steroidobacteraceae bacterium]
MSELTSNQSRQPRYRVLADLLIGEIRAGQLAVGETMPGEHELVQRFSVSRHTVREALRVLTGLGLIDRQQGIGTVVRSRDSTVGYTHTAHAPKDLLQYPADSQLRVVNSGMVKLNRRLAKLMGATVGSSWLRIGSLRTFKLQKRPLCWTDIYLIPEYAEALQLIGKRQIPVYELIEKRFGEKIESVHIDVEASTLSGQLAATLDVQPGSASLRIVRRYTGKSKRVFEVSVAEHPADRYRFALELNRDWRAQRAWNKGA